MYRTQNENLQIEARQKEVTTCPRYDLLTIANISYTLTDDLKAVVAGTLVAEVLTVVGAAVQPLLTHPLAGELLPTPTQ